MSEEIKELLFLLHNDRLTEASKRKLEQEIERLNQYIDFYKELGEKQNKELQNLKQKVKYYENFEINKTIDKIRIENNKRFKEQQEELESLKQANEDHQNLNGELRVENDRLNNIINELEKKIISICETCYENRETARIEEWIKELKGSEKE